MQNVDLFVFVLAGSSLRALAFICGMKGSSPRLGSWMCLHTAGTGLEEECRACVQVPELSTAFCHHSPSRHTSGKQAQALRGYRCLVSGDPCESLTLCCVFPFELFNLAPFWVPPRQGSSLPFDSTPSQTPLEDQKCCMLFLHTSRVKTSRWGPATHSHFHTPATKISQLSARRVGTRCGQEPTIPNY